MIHSELVLWHRYQQWLTKEYGPWSAAGLPHCLFPKVKRESNVLWAIFTWLADFVSVWKTGMSTGYLFLLPRSAAGRTNIKSVQQFSRPGSPEDNTGCTLAFLAQAQLLPACFPWLKMAQGTYLPSTWLPPSLCLLLLIHICVTAHLPKRYSDNQMFQSDHGISEKMLHEHLDHWDNVCSVWKKKSSQFLGVLHPPSASCTITGLSLHHNQPGLQKTKSLKTPALQKNPKAVHTARTFWKKSSSREQWEDWLQFVPLDATAKSDIHR